MFVRRSTTADASFIAEMSRRTFVETFAEHNTEADMDKFLSTQFTAAQLEKEAVDANNTFLLAYYEEEPAGYLFLKNNTHESLTDKDAIEISRLYAYKKFIGKGVGKALMITAIDHTLAACKHTIWLGVWEHNLRAIDFYSSFGFEKFAEHDFILGDDVQVDWLMKLGV